MSKFFVEDIIPKTEGIVNEISSKKWRFYKKIRFFTASLCEKDDIFGEKSEKCRKGDIFSKTLLTSGKKGGRIIEPQNGRVTPKESGSQSKRPVKKFLKKVEKTFKKVLTSEKECDIIVKLSARRIANGH